MKQIFDLIKKLNYLLTSKQKRLGALVFICAILAAAFELLGVSVIIPLINVMVSPDKLAENRYIRMIFPDIDRAENSTLIVYVVITVILIYIAKNLFFIFNAWLKNKYSFMVQREMSVSMMKKYMQRGYEYFLNHNYSELRQGIDGDVRALYYVVNEILQITTQLMITVFIGIYMLMKDWKLAMGAVITGILCMALILGFFRRRMAESGRRLREYSIKAEKRVDEVFHGIKMVMIGRKEKHFIDGYNDEVTKRNKIDVVVTAGKEMPAYIIEAVAITGIMTSLCIRLLSMEDPGAFVAVLGAFAMGMFRILPAIGKISSSSNGIISSIPGFNSVYSNMSYNNKNNEFLMIDNEDSVDVRLSREIRIDGIYYKYTTSKDYVLNDLSMVIPKGASVALVGESGAGKSTMADILLGLLKPERGSIKVDGVDLYKLNREWWNRVAYVPQTIFLTDNSIRENVAYGIPEHDIDDDKVRNALKKANILDFAESLPQGIETLVGDRGVRLSGGQRQRIGIARALYNNPDILVLDEATSALDNETETAVMEAVESLMGDITMLIIAHRLTTIRNCDQIYEIRRGKAYPCRYEDL